MLSRLVSRKGAMPHLIGKAPVMATAQNSIVLEGLQVVDGYTTISGDRILLIGQIDGTDNGIWLAKVDAWERAVDWNDDDDVISGMLLIDQNASTGFQVTFAGNFSLGVTDPTFTAVYGELTVTTVIEEGVYNSGYTFTFVDADTFNIDGLDATAMLSAGRRLKFQDGDIVTYGSIVTSTYDGTDTTVEILMEDSEDLTTNITKIYFSPGAGPWPQITEDPFAGTSANAIRSGTIAGVVWWVVVGDGGKIFTSTDRCQTWVSRASGTTEHLISIGFDSVAEKFMVTGYGSAVIFSDDGITWTFKSALGDTKSPTADGKTMVDFDYELDYWIIAYHRFAGTQYYSMYSSNDGDSWVDRDSSLGLNVIDIQYSRRIQTGTEQIYMNNANSTNTLDNSNDTNSSVYIGSQSAVINGYTTFFDGAIDKLLMAKENGEIKIYENDISPVLISKDDVTFAYGMIAAAHSTLHGRTVVVGKNSLMGYVNDADSSTDDAFTLVANEFYPTASINAVWFDETDAMFAAVASNGQICTSQNGIS